MLLQCAAARLRAAASLLVLAVVLPALGTAGAGTAEHLPSPKLLQALAGASPTGIAELLLGRFGTAAAPGARTRAVRLSETRRIVGGNPHLFTTELRCKVAATELGLQLPYPNLDGLAALQDDGSGSDEVLAGRCTWQLAQQRHVQLTPQLTLVGSAAAACAFNADSRQCGEPLADNLAISARGVLLRLAAPHADAAGGEEHNAPPAAAALVALAPMNVTSGGTAALPWRSGALEFVVDLEMPVAGGARGDRATGATLLFVQHGA